MTIYDIAKLAGVSKSTVSRVINNDSKVGEVSRTKVLEVMKKNNFVPNKSARNILTKKKKYIAVIVTRLDSYSENRVIRGIIEKGNNDVEVIIFESQFDIEKTKEIVLENTNFDVFVVFAIGLEKYEFFRNIHIPVIFVGQKVSGYPSVTYRDSYAMSKLFSSTCQNGDKLLYFALPDIDPTSGKIRNDSLRSLCIENKVSIDFLTVEYSIDSKYILPVINNLDKYDVILCATDSIALFVYIHLLKNNYNSVLGGLGNNRSVTRFMDNYISISLGYKQSGKLIMQMIEKNEFKNIVVDCE